MALAGATALGVGLLAMFFGAQSPAELPKLPARGAGVTLSQIARAPRAGALIAASDGDWLLESDRVRLVVGADAPGAERQLRFGAIIDATVKDFADDILTDLRP